MKTSKEMLILIFITAVGTILRILALDVHDFWFDEAITYHFAILPAGELFKATATDFNPPLYYLLIHFLVKINQGEIFLRLPSLFASLITIPAIFFLFSKLIGKKIALISSALFSVSPLALYLATEARSYSLAVLLTTIVTAAFFNLTRGPNLKNILFFTVFVTLAIYTHYYTLLLFLPFILIIAFTETKTSLYDFLKIVSIPLLLALPWVLFSAQTEHNNCSCPSTLLSLPSALVSPTLSGVGLVTLRSFKDLSFPTLTLFSIAAISIIFLLIIGVIRNPKVAIIYLLPLFTISLAGLLFPVFSPKAFSIFMTTFFLITAIGINSLRDNLTTYLTLVLLVGVSVIQITNPFFRGDKLKEITRIVQRDQNSPLVHSSLVTYYSTRFYTKDQRQNLLVSPNPLSSATIKYIGGQQIPIDPAQPTIWLIDTLKWADSKTHREIVNSLGKNFEAIDSYKLEHITVSYLKRK